MGLARSNSYLGDVEVEAEALSLPLHLPHAQLAGELAGAEAQALQREGAVQAALGTAPDVVERNLLRNHNQTHTRETWESYTSAWSSQSLHTSHNVLSWFT